VAVVFYSWDNIASPLTLGTSKLDLMEQRLEALEKRFDAASLASTQATGDPIPLSDELNKLKAKIDNEDSKGQQLAQAFIAQAFAFLDLREVAKSGRAFSPQLATLRVAAADNPKILAWLPKIEPYAAEPPPTLDKLRETLTFEAKVAPAPVGEKSSAWAKVKSIFDPLISVRSKNDARFTILEGALDAGNVPAALEAFKALPEDTQKSLTTWKAKLEARATIDGTMQALSAFFTAPPSNGNAP
jgi:hypothetical protein